VRCQLIAILICTGQSVRGVVLDDQQHRLSLAEILSSEWAEPGAEDGATRWPVIAPRSLAMISLRDCEEQLCRAKDEPLRLVQAAKSAHLALQAALVEALAGSANVGAHDDKLGAKWLAYLNGDATLPESDRIMPFNDLLAKAMEHPMEWSGRKLEVSADGLEALKRLTFIRDCIEHTRPSSHIIAPPFIALTLPVAAMLTLELLHVCGHRYEEGERALVAATVTSITDRCATIE
jgi:hypothetical protein